jgi:hypothetical protein
VAYQLHKDHISCCQNGPGRLTVNLLQAVLAFAAETMLPHVASAMLTVEASRDGCCSTTLVTRRDSRCAAACTWCRFSCAPVPRTGQALTRRGPTPTDEYLVIVEESMAGATS